MMKYSRNSAMKDITVALPAIFVSLALSEITTAPSIPMKIHTVVNIVALTYSKSDISEPAPVKLSTKISQWNDPAKIAAITMNTIGIALAITTNAFITVA